MRFHWVREAHCVHYFALTHAAPVIQQPEVMCRQTEGTEQRNGAALEARLS